MSGFREIWSYLAAEPLTWLAATLAAWLAADAIHRAAGRHPLANPVLIAVAVLGATLLVTGTPYPTFFEGAQFIHFLLGPATVSLALPLWERRALVRRAFLPVLAGLAATVITSIGSALAIGAALGIGRAELIALAPKSATAPVAMGVSEALGGSPTLTAVLVIATGISGAMIATPLLNRLGIHDWRARGLAVGAASHGIGTARAWQVHPTAGTFAGLGMALGALLTALLAPPIVALLLP